METPHLKFGRHYRLISDVKPPNLVSIEIQCLELLSITKALLRFDHFSYEKCRKETLDLQLGCSVIVRLPSKHSVQDCTVSVCVCV